MDITVTITYKGKIDETDFKDGETQMEKSAILEQIKAEIEDEGPDQFDLEFDSVKVEEQKAGSA